MKYDITIRLATPTGSLRKKNYSFVSVYDIEILVKNL